LYLSVEVLWDRTLAREGRNNSEQKPADAMTSDQLVMYWANTPEAVNFLNWEDGAGHSARRDLFLRPRAILIQRAGTLSGRSKGS
jgi:hypothetical protein